MLFLKKWAKAIFQKKRFNMYVSIVLYHHNQEDIQATLDSLLSSSSIKKIILVDNGGSEWAEHLQHESIIYLKSPKNGGYGFGHNLAIKKYAHESEFFLICNPDVYFYGQDLDEFLNIAKQQPHGLFSPRVLYPDGSNQYGQRLLPTPLNLFARRFLPELAAKLDEAYLLKHRTFDGLANVPTCSGCFMLFRSSALLELKGFDERFFMYMEDVDLSRRCFEKFGNCFVPSIAIYHQHEQGSYKNPMLLKYHIQSAIKYFNKWGWIFDKRRSILNDIIT